MEQIPSDVFSVIINFLLADDVCAVDALPGEPDYSLLFEADKPNFAERGHRQLAPFLKAAMNILQLNVLRLEVCLLFFSERAFFSIIFLLKRASVLSAYPVYSRSWTKFTAVLAKAPWPIVLSPSALKWICCCGHPTQAKESMQCVQLCSLRLVLPTK